MKLSEKRHRRNFQDLSGMKFEKIRVIKESDRNPYDGKILWDVICDCGTKFITQGTSLKTGKTKSCGCLRMKKNNQKYATQDLKFDDMYAK